MGNSIGLDMIEVIPQKWDCAYEHLSYFRGITNEGSICRRTLR
ncbi:hypothetical protein Krac_11447 [Ktedonobacter racemifer DSM 44963]|uniref:Uncharacterized protein n=1 Tax=Ktedonobacter racemifer DSM 44963 TaxID=485913 RepID=D6TBT2_KTERA|nr:hypothetical protein Krac_11447 [Ktedonobacter racemifer DSM 44963]